jgi:hypothetical protein
MVLRVTVELVGRSSVAPVNNLPGLMTTIQGPVSDQLLKGGGASSARTYSESRVRLCMRRLAGRAATDLLADTAAHCSGCFVRIKTPVTVGEVAPCLPPASCLLPPAHCSLLTAHCLRPPASCCSVPVLLALSSLYGWRSPFFASSWAA